jgi:hypothetical protein
MKWLVVIISALFCLTCAGSANGNATNESYTYTFIQEGTGGSFVNDSSGNYTLTITGVIPYTVGFSDRPARNAGFAKMDAFLAGFSFDPKNPPNAAVIIQGAKEEEDMVIVELTSPKYDEMNQTLTYTAKLTKDLAFESDWASDLTSNADKAIPEKFGKVLIVIDDCPCLGYDGCKSGYHDSCWCWNCLPPGCIADCGRCC